MPKIGGQKTADARAATLPAPVDVHAAEEPRAIGRQAPIAGATDGSGFDGVHSGPAPLPRATHGSERTLRPFESRIAARVVAAGDEVTASPKTAAIREALSLLGVDHFVLQVHDRSFPGDADEDVGRGSPYSKGAARFLARARSLGFNGIQLGPPGMTELGDASPYDGTVFSRNPLNLSLARLVDDGLLSKETEAALAHHGGDHVDDAAAHRAMDRALDEAFATMKSARPDLQARLDAYLRENADWVVRDGLWGALVDEHGAALERWAETPQGALDAKLFARGSEHDPPAQARLAELKAKYAERIERHGFAQMLLSDQHAAFRRTMHDEGFRLYGDFQIGFAQSDLWAYRGVFLDGYRMGAPPSRTNPDGQPWNYPLLDPALYRNADGSDGPALLLFRRRVAQMLEEYDAIRVDHPHGLVSPWVYRSDDGDAVGANQRGARLFSSPDLPDHPALAKYALVRPEQLDKTLPRYADAWERSLEPEQVEKLGVLFDALMDAFLESGRPKEDLLVEVLSTLPRPLAEAIRKHAVGRFRVTQKAKPGDPNDVYSTARAQPADWVMMGNHDTKPMHRLFDEWKASGRLKLEVDALSARFAPNEADRETLRARFLASPAAFAEGKLAELFLSDARNVMVFVSDLLGEKDVYNTPGTVSESNWSLRVDGDWPEHLAGRGGGIDVARALALAVRARGPEHAELLAALEA